MAQPVPGRASARVVSSLLSPRVSRMSAVMRRRERSAGRARPARVGPEWDRYNYVLEAMRVLRPGGRLYVDNVGLTGDEGWAMSESLRAIPPAKRPPYISKTSTPDELITYLGRAGFADVRHDRRGRWVMA